jgi:Plant mobile domain
MFYILQLHNTLRLNTHHLKIPYDEQMDPYMSKLELYQMATMGDCHINKSLIIVLVERWRSKTSIFHIPVGEMIVTLEDVCSL